MRKLMIYGQDEKLFEIVDVEGFEEFVDLEGLKLFYEENKIMFDFEEALYDLTISGMLEYDGDIEKVKERLDNVEYSLEYFKNLLKERMTKSEYNAFVDYCEKELSKRLGENLKKHNIK